LVLRAKSDALSFLDEERGKDLDFGVCRWYPAALGIGLAARPNRSK
jgi:hypothetical protein